MTEYINYPSYATGFALRRLMTHHIFFGRGHPGGQLSADAYRQIDGKGVDPDTKVGGRHTCQPREKFWRDKRGATERSEPSS